ncbi:MAG: hypothetical protein AAGF47_01360 [Planctomycetota bacterium]
MTEIELKPRADSERDQSVHADRVDMKKLRHDMRGCIGIILTYMHILENAKPGTDLTTISKPCKESAHELESLIKTLERSEAERV